MKRIILIIALLPMLLVGQTKNIVPRADGQGRLGTASKAWLAVHADSIYLAGSVLQDIIQDSVDLRISTNIAGLDDVPDASIISNYIVVSDEDNIGAYKMYVTDLPPSNLTRTLLNSYTTNLTFEAYQNTVDSILALYNGRISALEQGIDTSQTPTPPTNLAVSTTPNSMILTWDNVDASADSTEIDIGTISGGVVTWGSIDALVARTSTSGTYTLSGLSVYQTRYFRVRNVKDGAISAWSNQANATITNNYYVSTSISGDGTGEGGFGNKALWSTFNLAQLQAGDTLFFDGGTDSLVYTLTSTKTITVSGNSTNRIVFTRGTDAGYNGVPIFKFTNTANADDQSWYLQNCNYLTIDNMKFYSTDPNNAYRRDNIYINNCNNLTLSRNQIDFTYGWGTVGEYSPYTRYLYNTFTDIALPIATADTKMAQPDPINLKYSYGLEIAYNTFTSRCPRTATDPHTDVIQLPYTNMDGSKEATTIHHNFITVDFSDEYATRDIFTIQQSAGEFLIYNNIINFNNGAGGVILGQNIGCTAPVYYRFYNNTLLRRPSASPTTYIFASVERRTGQFADPTLSYKNNIFDLSPNESLAAGTGTTIDSSNNFKNYGFTFAGDVTTSISMDTSDYRITGAAVDGGANLSSYFTDDFAGNTRDGAWDAGAFESLGGGGATYGSELIANPDFASGITSWNLFGTGAGYKWYSSDWKSIGGVSGFSSAILDSASSVSSSNVRVTTTLLTALDNTKSYKIEYDYFIPATNVTANQLQVYTSGVTTQQVELVTTVGSWVHRSFTYNPTYNNTSIAFRMFCSSTGNETGLTQYDYMVIDNVSVKEIL